MKNIIIGIDLGSNSFRVLKYNKKDDKSIGEFETTVGTADGLKQTGVISKEALKRIIDAITQSVKQLNYNPQDAIAVTTSAMRQAKNSAFIIEQIQAQTGVRFTIIEGDEEARLTLVGLQYSLKKQKYDYKNLILADIGGGSTELVFVKDEVAIYKSFEVGIVTLTQSANKQEILEEFKNAIKELIGSLNYSLKNIDMVATSGTPTTIAALKNGLNYTTYDKEVINGSKVYLKDLQYYKNYLTTCEINEAIALVGTDKIDYVLSGIEIFSLLYEVLQKEFSVVFDEGLREGVVINEIKEVI